MFRDEARERAPENPPRHDDVERRRDLDCKPSNILNGEGTAENADMELKVKPCATMAGAPATHVIAYMSF